MQLYEMFVNDLLMKVNALKMKPKYVLLIVVLCADF